MGGDVGVLWLRVGMGDGRGGAEKGIFVEGGEEGMRWCTVQGCERDWLKGHELTSSRVCAGKDTSILFARRIRNINSDRDEA